jgi:hypothetical protein
MKVKNCFYKMKEGGIGHNMGKGENTRAGNTQNATLQHSNKREDTDPEPLLFKTGAKHEEHETKSIRRGKKPRVA